MLKLQGLKIPLDNPITSKHNGFSSSNSNIFHNLPIKLPKGIKSNVVRFITKQLHSWHQFLFQFYSFHCDKILCHNLNSVARRFISSYSILLREVRVRTQGQGLGNGTIKKKKKPPASSLISSQTYVFLDFYTAQSQILKVDVTYSGLSPPTLTGTMNALHSCKHFNLMYFKLINSSIESPCSKLILRCIKLTDESRQRFCLNNSIQSFH